MRPKHGCAGKEQWRCAGGSAAQAAQVLGRFGLTGGLCAPGRPWAQGLPLPRRLSSLCVRIPSVCVIIPSLRMCLSHHPPQAALPAEVFQGFIAALKPKQQQRLQEVLSA